MAPSAKSTTEGEKRPKRASGWLGGLFQGRGKDGKVPIKADLGKKLDMYYNEELGAWVEPGKEDVVRSALRPPPPPKGAITSVPDHSTAADADAGTPGRASSTEMSSSSSIASVAPPRASMNGSQGRNRSVRSRYAAMPGLGTSTTDTAATASSAVNHMLAAPPVGPKAFFVPAAIPAEPESDAQKEGLAPMYASNGSMEHVNGEAGVIGTQHQLQDGEEEVEELAEAPTFSAAGLLEVSGAIPADPEDGARDCVPGTVDGPPAWGLEEPGLPGLEQGGLEMEGGLEMDGGLEAAAEEQLGLEAAPGVAEEALPGDGEATNRARDGVEHDTMGQQATVAQAEGAAGWDADPWELYFRAMPDLHQQYLRSLQELCQGEGYEARWAQLTQWWERMVAAYPDIEIWSTERWYDVAAQDPQVAAYYQASSLLQIAQQQAEAGKAAEASGGEAWGVSYDPYMNMVFNDAFHSQPQAMQNGAPEADKEGPRESGGAPEEQPLWNGAAAEDAAGPDSASAKVGELEGVLQHSAPQSPPLEAEWEASQQESELEVPFLEQDAREGGSVGEPDLPSMPSSPCPPADAGFIAPEADEAGDRVVPSPSPSQLPLPPQQPLELDDLKAKAEPVSNGMVLTTDQIFSLGASSLDDAGSEWAALGSDTDSASGSMTPDAVHPADDAPAASSAAAMPLHGAEVHARLLRPLERGHGAASACAALDPDVESAALGRAVAGGGCAAAPPSPRLASASEAMLQPSASAADDSGSVAAATIDSMSIVSSLPDDSLPPAPQMPTASTSPSVPDAAAPQQLPGSWRLELPEEQAMMPPTHDSPADAAMQLLHSMQETVRQMQAHTPQQAALLADLENRQQHVLYMLQSMLSAPPAGMRVPSPSAGADADADDAPAEQPAAGKGAMPSASAAGGSTSVQPPQEQVPEQVQEQSDIGTPLREHEGRRSQHLGYKSPCLPSHGSPVDSQAFAQLPDAPLSASSSQSAASAYRRRQLEAASQAVAGPSWAAPVQLTLNIIPEASGEAELEGALAELQQERQELCRRLEQRELEAAQAQAQASTLEAEIDSLREMAAAVEALRSELEEKDEEFNDLLTCLGQESAKVGALSAMLQEQGCDVEAVLAAVEDEYGWGDGDDGDGNGEPGKEQEQEGGDAEAGPSGMESMASWDNAVFEP